MPTQPISFLLIQEHVNYYHGLKIIKHDSNNRTIQLKLLMIKLNNSSSKQIFHPQQIFLETIGTL